MATCCGPWESALFEELNRARTAPAAVAQELEQLKACYDGVMYHIPGTNKVMRTQEGIAALNHAVQWMAKRQPLPPLRRISEGLSRGAYDLVVDNGSRGLVSNALSDGTTAQQRFVRYGQWKGKVGENICFNMADPRQILYQWLIDDGNGNRPNRSSVMDAQFTTVGIAQGPHTAHGNMVVCTFALAYIEGQPGQAPAVGQKSAPGMHTIQYEDRKTEEQTLAADDDWFVIETDDLEVNSTKTLQLLAKAKVLTLSKTFEQAGKTKKKNFQWQLPFTFAPARVEAHFHDRRVKIRIPKEQSAMSTGNEEVPIGQYSLQAGSNEPTVKVDVKKMRGDYIITAYPSMFNETVKITYKADMVIFTCTHVGPDGRETGLAQPLRLPFVLAPNLFAVATEPQKLLVTVSKP
eukprot:CAMPEP_0114616536 /NCGR_PEP_ID=MMETSP0168-20121206/6736_1 /TAXON_ID=95228 ORGANISM="Vannella sp., Strain DIVA3 517/6/12" /NCGR_SAMPLE_ID=MMETSP0168 /ASSEMBLY_ACC=CAM_ASM_000044 /LENGTH=405 /DNA_ID=CAMNT_0001827651 /DNA_START=26 /DNA_END=1239 /DNA_ORIENTATION=+